MAAPVRIDYDRIEPDWRAGIKSAQQMADEYTLATGQKVSHAGISKHFKKLGIPRDLIAKINGEKIPLNLFDEKNTKGFVYVIYFIDSQGNRFCKIGLATILINRLKEHQCSSPFEMYIACSYFVLNMRAEEKYLHSYFNEKKIRGEWFNLSNNDLEIISRRSLLI